MELFRKMVETLSVSGNEEELAKLIEGEIAPYVDEITYDVMGNLIARKKGAPGAKKMMLSAHMDEIGFMVVGYEAFSSEGLPENATSLRFKGKGTLLPYSKKSTITL